MGKNNKTPKWMFRFFDTIYKCWQYHQPCTRINMQSSWDEDTKIWHIKAAPVFQEVYGGNDDGKRVWAGFIFDMGMFSRAEGVFLKEFAFSSYCNGCSEHPKMMAYGKFEGRSISLQIFLEPVADTETVELLDTINQKIRVLPEQVQDESDDSKKS